MAGSLHQGAALCWFSSPRNDLVADQVGISRGAWQGRNFIELAFGAQEEQERNRRILAALEGEKQDLASRHERLSVMLDQTKV